MVRAVQAHYRDDGCEVSAPCQGCPLERCKYDVEDDLDEVGLVHLVAIWPGVNMYHFSAATLAKELDVPRTTAYRISRLTWKQYMSRIAKKVKRM